jgi:magnesium chelatase subunit D
MTPPGSPAGSRLSSLRVLAAVASHPGLRRLLLFDATAQDLDTVAGVLERLLGAATGGPVSRVMLAPFHDEDDLWGLGEGLPAGWHRPGLLVSPAGDSAWRLVILPDLSTLSLAAARSCLQLLENDLGRLERHGQSRSWPLRLAWLAACPSQAVGQISPHLLDRFPLRLQAALWQERDRAADLRSWLDSMASLSVSSLGGEIDRLVDTVEAARSRTQALQTLDGVAVETVLELMGAWEAPGVRRHLGLARLSQALAKLDGADGAEAAHVREAAGLVGIAALEAPAAAPLPKPASPEERPSERTRKEEPGIGERAAAAGLAGRVGTDDGPAMESPAEPVLPAGEAETEPDAAATLISLSPFPEDKAPVERFPAPLQLPSESVQRRSRRGGPAAGVRRTSDPGELALVPTLFAAAPYQALRRRLLGQTDHRLLVTAGDWRARRRAPRPEDLLVLLLDVTAREGSDWPAALVPFLREAYVRRSAVCVILVGAEGARHELRAERVLARSVLAPEILAALDRGPGRATPLASGLQLALEAIRDASHRGRGAVLRARLVVLSDGRGNVPLEASRAGHLDGPVVDEGVRDALGVAARIAALDRVETVLLDPQPAHARHLVVKLAEALEARSETVPLREHGSGPEATP